MDVQVEVARESFDVREPCAVELVVTADGALDAGDTVAWQLPHTWTALHDGATYTKPFGTDDPAGAHHVAATAPEASFDVAVRERHLPDADAETRHGRRFVATVAGGSVPAGAPIRLRAANTRAPFVAGTEPAWVRVADAEPATAPLVTAPGPAETVRVIAPSGVEPGEAFDVLVVSLDAHGNRSASRFEGVDLRTADGEVVAHDLGFVGGIRVSVALDDPGVHRLSFDGTLSNPVRVAEGARGPYWGDVHVHTGLSSDGQGTDPYGYARDVSGLDFAATTEHASSLGERGHERVLERAADADRPGTFVALPAYEPSSVDGAHYNAYFRSGDAYREGRRRDLVATIRGEGEEALPPESAFMFLPHHTGIGWATVDLGETIAPSRCPAVEIYSHHGQSEAYAPGHALAYEFNRYRRTERRVNRSSPGPHYAQDFWMAGYRLGTIASSDEHTGRPGLRHGGIAAVFADDLSRGGVFDAIRSRDCYGTTGERILLDFSIGGAGMGGVQSASPGERLALDLRVHGTDRLVNVEVPRHRFGTDERFLPVLDEVPAGPGADAATQRPETMDAAYERTVEVEGDAVYYARVTQAPVERPGMAWSSPIWIEADGA